LIVERWISLQFAVPQTKDVAKRQHLLRLYYTSSISWDTQKTKLVIRHYKKTRCFAAVLAPFSGGFEHPQYVWRKFLKLPPNRFPQINCGGYFELLVSLFETPAKLRRLFRGGSKPPQNNKIGKKN
jgi:hypothetical protein